ncbi:MAG TPA: serine/threonine-protein kinase, partial [Pyrinomonadaceae bacterium]|nr:serine/threonine-protein kinase [Pyrinomonadaceae bacterium]
MTPERWQKIEHLYHSALEQDDRAAFLRAACLGDEVLRQEVEKLLDCDARAEHFVEAPALVVAAQLHSGEQSQSGEAIKMYDTSSPIEVDSSMRESESLATAPIFIGDYRVIRKIGEGGMGVVYEAEQQHPRRFVALKVIRGGRIIGENQIKLFQREVRALARLKHPGIAAIYESGSTNDEQYYFAMELVHGVPLLEYVKGQKDTSRQTPGGIRKRLKLFLKVCDAISYAHQRGVIHRDLKPANILVTDESERQSLNRSLSGYVEIKVLDFGLARVIDDDGACGSSVSELGLIKGTLPYMSPEQVCGDPESIDVRTDVYGLGVILYELLTERFPYKVEWTALPQVIRVICEEMPKSPSRVWRETGGQEGKKTGRVDRDLETIVLKALEKDPERRYQSAAAMAEDVERYLTNRPIEARPPSAFYQFRKLVARHKTPFALLAIVFVLLLGFTVMMAVQSARLAHEELFSRRLLYAAHMNLAMKAWEALDIGQMQELIESHIPKPGEEDMRGFEWYYLWRLYHQELLTIKGP